MTDPQLQLLQACVKADRAYRSALAAGDPWTSNDHRGVEIGAFTGFSSRTADALAAVGLIELVNLRGKNNYAFLGAYHPVDEVEL